MKLRRITGNCVELTSSDGAKLLFSYSDVVAAYHPALGWMKSADELTKSSQWSVRQWLDEQDAENVQSVSQSVLDTLLTAGCQHA
jgi:hypothetical protein